MKVLISKKTGRYYYYDHDKDFHCKEGVIKKEDLESGEMVVKSHLGKELMVFEANSYDMRQKFSRGPQTMTPKDLGYITARAGLTKHSKIVEAGGGSGSATCYFAQLVDSVHTYEIVDEHIPIIEKNLNLCNIDNVTLTKGDLNDHIEEETDIDMLFLDMPDPQIVIQKPLSALKKGRYVVCYVPSVTQILEVTRVVGERPDLYLEEVSEVMVREWKAWDRVARPLHRKEIDHTAFLVFIRKI